VGPSERLSFLSPLRCWFVFFGQAVNRRQFFYADNENEHLEYIFHDNENKKTWRPD
jgi:hypothetical protein